ncbi:hypothetical protein ONZ45_g13097 [Pleurotus djamor]|nr:hypothetical protein ONZ45_g13097 [Pleurotus djamor]
MSLARQTRSGAVFSPWHTDHLVQVSVDAQQLLHEAALRGDEEPVSENAHGGAPSVGTIEVPPEPTFGNIGTSNDVKADVPESMVYPNGKEGDEELRRKGCERGLNTEEASELLPTNITMLPHPTSAHVSRGKAYFKEKRRKRRLEAQPFDRREPKVISKLRCSEADVYVAEDSAFSKSKYSLPGYTGVRHQSGELSSPDASFDDLIAQGYTYIPWDGMTGITIVDSEGRGIVYGASPKDTSGWKTVHVDCAEAIDQARNQCSFRAQDKSHRRGDFPALAYGISFGQGQTVPSRLLNSSVNTRALERLVQQSSLKRIAGFQGSLLRTFSPNLAQYYDETLSAIEEEHSVRRNFHNSDYASITFNFGPRTVSIPHHDVANLAYGLCAITALGNFNPDKSGFLVLRELRIIIRFPPGSTLLVPSALVEHYNLPISPNETRYSVTQYSAGGLFRWVNNGMCLNSQRSEAAELRSKEEWELGLRKLPLFDCEVS